MTDKELFLVVFTKPSMFLPESIRESTTLIFPFKPKDTSPMESVELLYQKIELVKSFCAEIIVVEDGTDHVGQSSQFVLEKFPKNLGKIAAVKRGIEIGLKRSGSAFFIIADYDNEQELKDIPLLIEKLSKESADAVIGNRYGRFPENEVPEHRKNANYFQEIMSRYLGFDVTDLASGLIGCNRAFAEIISEQSRSDHEGPGFEWVVLAFLNKKRLINVPIRAEMRSDRTNGLKIARNLQIILNYETELGQAGKEDLIKFCENFKHNLEKNVGKFALNLDLIGGQREIVAIKKGADYSLERSDPHKE